MHSSMASAPHMTGRVHEGDSCNEADIQHEILDVLSACMWSSLTGYPLRSHRFTETSGRCRS